MVFAKLDRPKWLPWILTGATLAVVALVLAFTGAPRLSPEAGTDGRQAAPGEAVQALAEQLHSGEAPYRRYAAMTLEEMAPDPAVLPVLIEALDSGDAYVRILAVHGLGKFAHEASVVVPHLLEVLKDRNRVVRIDTVLALGKMPRGDKRIVTALVEKLKDKDEWVRVMAFQALARRGAEACSAIPAIRESLRDPSADVREAAAAALNDIVKLPISAASAVALATSPLGPSPLLALGALTAGTTEVGKMTVRTPALAEPEGP